jgi:hypothetical protein
MDHEKLYRHLLDKHRMQAWPIKDEIVQGLWVAPLIYSRAEDVEAFGEVLLKIAREGLPKTTGHLDTPMIIQRKEFCAL